MPAVSPTRLRHEIEELAEFVAQPEQLTARLLTLVRFYADYTHRPGSVTEADDAPWVLNLPGPVQHEIERALLRWFDGKEDPARALISRLWSTGYREVQFIAVRLLEEQTGQWVPDWAEERFPDCKDQPALRKLAVRGLSGWRDKDRERFRKRIDSWLSEKHGRSQAFGFLACIGFVKKEKQNAFPLLFSILEGYHWELHGEARKAFLGLFEQLMAISDRETAGFLRMMLEKKPEQIQELMLELRPFFPDSRSGLFRQALSL